MPTYTNGNSQTIFNEFYITGLETLSVSTATTLLFNVGNIYPSLTLKYADLTKETLTSLATISGLTVDGTYSVVKEKGQWPSLILTSGLSGGTAISGGDYSGYPASNAFDGTYLLNSALLTWASSQVYTAVSGVSYIGKNFGSSRTIRTIKLTQDTDATFNVSSVKIQTSTNGTTWVDAQTFAVSAGTNILNLTTPVNLFFISITTFLVSILS